MNVLDEQLLRKFVDYLSIVYWDSDTGEWTKVGNDDDHINSRYDFGNSFQMCMALIGALQENGHAVQFVGAGAEEFPDDTAGSGIGLDWLVVDNHVVVDPWSYGSADHNLKIVYDLNDPKDAATVGQLYPPRDKWEPLEVEPSKVKFYNAIWHDYILPYDVVDRLINEQ